MDVLSILQKKRQKVTGFEVKINAPRSAEHPQVFTSAEILFIDTGTNVSEAAVLRSIELSFTKYCPVQKMLEGAVPMELHYEIYEEVVDGDRRLTAQGEWQEVPQE
jgi:putative redox protein